MLFELRFSFQREKQKNKTKKQKRDPFNSGRPRGYVVSNSYFNKFFTTF